MSQKVIAKLSLAHRHFGVQHLRYSTVAMSCVAKTIAELPLGAAAGSEDENIVPGGPKGFSPE